MATAGEMDIALTSKDSQLVEEDVEPRDTSRDPIIYSNGIESEQAIIETMVASTQRLSFF